MESIPEKQLAEAERIRGEVEAFMAKGGQIQQMDRGATADDLRIVDGKNNRKRYATNTKKQIQLRGSKLKQ